MFETSTSPESRPEIPRNYWVPELLGSILRKGSIRVARDAGDASNQVRSWKMEFAPCTCAFSAWAPPFPVPEGRPEKRMRSMRDMPMRAIVAGSLDQVHRRARKQPGDPADAASVEGAVRDSTCYPLGIRHAPPCAAVEVSMVTTSRLTEDPTVLARRHGRFDVPRGPRGPRDRGDRVRRPMFRRSEGSVDTPTLTPNIHEPEDL